jgi:hypothetical protein
VPHFLEQAGNRFGALGHKLGQAHVELARGDLARNRGDLAAAEHHYRNMIEFSGDMGDESMRARGLSLLGLTLLAQGDIVAARRAVIDGARANLAGGQPTSISYSLDGLAAVALTDGRPDVAARAMAAASAVRERMRHVLSPALRPLVQDLHSRARDQLGDDTYEAACAQGRTWHVTDVLQRTPGHRRLGASHRASLSGLRRVHFGQLEVERARRRGRRSSAPLPTPQNYGLAPVTSGGPP